MQLTIRPHDPLIRTAQAQIKPRTRITARPTVIGIRLYIEDDAESGEAAVALAGVEAVEEGGVGGHVGGDGAAFLLGDAGALHAVVAHAVCGVAGGGVEEELDVDCGCEAGEGEEVRGVHDDE